MRQSQPIILWIKNTISRFVGCLELLSESILYKVIQSSIRKNILNFLVSLELKFKFLEETDILLYLVCEFSDMH